MGWGRKKIPKEEVEEDYLDDDEATVDELPMATKRKTRQKTKTVSEPKQNLDVNEYNFSSEEMEQIVIPALANTEEYKMYRLVVIGEKIHNVIESYRANK